MSKTSGEIQAASKRTRDLRQAFKFALSLVLFYAYALTVNWDVLNYGALAIVLVSLEIRGASLQKGIARIIGTTIGVLVGFAVLSLFQQDRWWVMIALASYLVLLSYGLQRSRTPYGWFVAGFLPLVIWGDNYPNFQGAFYFGTFRWLQTTVGILIYTLVDCLLWPRRAGDELLTLQRPLWESVAKLLDLSIADDSKSEEREASRSQAAGAISSAEQLVQQAAIDTVQVRMHRAAADRLILASARSLNAVELLGEAVRSCRQVGLGNSLSGLADAIAPLRKRFETLAEVGHQAASRREEDAEQAALSNDGGSGEALGEISAVNLVGQSLPRRAAAAFLRDQIAQLELASGEALSAVTGKKPDAQSGSEVGPRLEWRRPDVGPTTWERWSTACFPACAFVPAFLFWILFNPPTGPKIPMMAGIFGLMIVLSPSNPIGLVGMMVVSMVVAVLPVYWWIMPTLESGESLLLLVFVFSFLFAYLGGKNSVFKAGPMMMFVNMSGISNEQSYSFQGPVDGGLMMILAGVFVTLAYLFYYPIQPERVLVAWGKRFAKGCRRVAGEFNVSDEMGLSPSRTYANLEMTSLILPAVSRVREQQAKLDYSKIEGVDAKVMQEFVDRLQSSANRTQAFQWSLARLGPLSDRSVAVLELIRPAIQGSFARLGAGDEPTKSNESRIQFDEKVDAESRWSRLAELLKSEEAAGGEAGEQGRKEPSAVDLYSLVGCANALIESNLATREAIEHVNWQGLATSRF